jgi:hypothetical protein
MFALAAGTLVLAAGGGIGGGALFVPLFFTLGGFPAGQAVSGARRRRRFRTM